VKRALTTLAAVGLVAFALGAASASGAAQGGLQLTPVGRLPFPERGFIVDLPERAAVDPAAVQVRENGRLVERLDVAPVGDAGIHFGVVLAVDASKSMAGPPLLGAVDAARSFVSRRDTEQRVGIVAFNSEVSVLQAPTDDPGLLAKALSAPPEVAYATRIMDAVDESLGLLARARLSSGSIVLLSDGADVGSTRSIDQVLAKARSRHVRIFSVGLRSRDFEAASLRRLAAGTGGSYAEASSPEQLAPIFEALGERLSGEYLLTYRSNVAPRSHVDVTVAFEGLGTASATYVAPTPASLKPFHRSLVSRFLLSPGAPAILSLLVAAFVAVAIMSFLRPRRSTLVERVRDFAGAELRSPADARAGRNTAIRSRSGGGWLAGLERTLDIGRIELRAARILWLTAAATALAVFVLALLSPVFAVLGLVTPLATRALIARKVRQVRGEFADQLAPNLQVLASALRIGHSFVAALTVVVENAHEPSRTELRRTLTDEQLGMPIDEAIQRVAERMASRDLEQVALLAELQRTTGGNAAEVLDTVVETLRERSDLRRLVSTLTAQGRLARWILSTLPLAAGLLMWVVQPDGMRSLFESTGGQAALVVSALMVLAGSLAIQKIVDIKV
jgi:tight adherence protein B